MKACRSILQVIAIFILPTIALADRYGVCDSGGCGGDPVSALLGLLMIGLIVWGLSADIPSGARYAFFGAWFGGSALWAYLGYDDLFEKWWYFGWIPAFFVMAKTEHVIETKKRRDHQSPFVGDSQIRNTNSPNLEVQSATQLGARGGLISSPDLGIWRTKERSLGSESEAEEDDRPFAREGEGYAAPITVENPSPAIRSEKLLETVGILEWNGDFLPVLEAFSWLPVAAERRIPISAEGTEVGVRLARRQGAYPGKLTPLGTVNFLSTGSTASRPRSVEIRISASKRGIEIQARDCGGPETANEWRGSHVE